MISRGRDNAGTFSREIQEAATVIGDRYNEPVVMSEDLHIRTQAPEITRNLGRTNFPGRRHYSIIDFREKFRSRELRVVCVARRTGTLTHAQ